MSALPEHPFRKLYTPDFDFPRYAGEPKTTYFLSAIPRVGSTWFSLQLWRTGVLGAPLEYLNMVDRESDVAVCGGNIHAYWRSVRERRTSPNGVFGSKLFTRDIRDAFDRQQTALELITADCLIHLRRRDRIKQAVSYARAMQTRVWIEGGIPPVKQPNYEFDLLLDCLEAIKRQEASWDAIAQRTGARVLTLYYEDYSADPRSAIGAVKEFLDVRDSARPLTRIPEIVKQRDATSTEWVRRFTRDLAEHNCTTSAKEEELEYATVKA